MATRVELLLRDLELPDAAITVCLWHAAVGQRVTEGDRLLEVLAGDVTVEIASPASGVLAAKCAHRDDLLTAGQLLAVIEAA